MALSLWHNPRCSKSRAALALLEQRGAPVEIRRYLEDAPSAAELRALARKIGGPVAAMVRKGEPAYKEAGLGPHSSDDALIAAMAAHPKLIERPVLIAEGRAVIGRPPEKVLELL